MSQHQENDKWLVVDQLLGALILVGLLGATAVLLLGLAGCVGTLRGPDGVLVEGEVVNKRSGSNSLEPPPSSR